MARTWVRVLEDVTCGFCGGVSGRGDPMLLIRLQGLKKRRFRCRSCAGEPVPADLPLLPEHTPTPAAPFSMVPVRRLAGLPLDWKHRAAGGEREPGQEG